MTPRLQLQLHAATIPEPPLVRLGETGLRVSRIGLGLAALGRPAYMALGRDVDLGADRSMNAMLLRCHLMLDAAYAAGIRYVDVARSYGLGERFLRGWFDARELSGDRLVVGSKWGYTYTGQWHLDAPRHEVKSLSVQTLRRQAAESDRVLAGRLSLYQIHSATLESGVLDDLRVLAELAELRDRGLCVGLTVTGPHQADVIRKALTIYADGQLLFQVVQATWNLLEPSAGAALAEAHAAGCGVIVKEVLANGRLTTRHADSTLSRLHADACVRGTTIEALAIAAALSQPWADVVLSGAVTVDQLNGHIEALALEEIDLPPGSIAEQPARYWQRRAELAWT
jgi:aryl-alcohol dehydrogenase-like predicted oxidoreductase